jgi:hypothetical protein
MTKVRSDIILSIPIASLVPVIYLGTLEHTDDYGIVFSEHQADSMASVGPLTLHCTAKFPTLLFKENDTLHSSEISNVARRNTE